MSIADWGWTDLLRFGTEPEHQSSNLMAMQGTAAGGPVHADGRQSAVRCECERKKLIGDAQDQFHPAGHRQLVIQALAVGVYGMR